MKKRSPPNVRIVRCPKCLERLAEPSDVPFYKCGGCGVTLQSKYYKKEDERTKSVSENSSDALEHVHQHGGESSGSSLCSIFSAQHSPDPYGEPCNSNLEQLGVPNSTGEASSSNDPCTTDMKVPSSQLAIVDGKIGEKQYAERCGGREAALTAEASSLEKHEALSESAPNFEDVGKGKKLDAKEVGLGSCSREAALLDASATPSPSDEKALSNGEVEQEGDQKFNANQSSEQIRVDDSENRSLPSSIKEYQEGQVDNAVDSRGPKSEIVTSSKESTLLQDKEISGLPLEHQERVNGASSNESFLLENKKMAETLMEKETGVGKVGHGLMDTKFGQFDGKPQIETSSSTVVDSREKDKPPCVAPGEENTIVDGKDQNKVVDSAREQLTGINFSTDPDESGKEVELQSLEANAIAHEIHIIHPPDSNTLVENEKLNLYDVAEVPMSVSKLSDDAGDASGQKIKGSDQKTIPNGDESVTSSEKVEGLELVNTKREVLDSPKILPQSPSRNSLAYDVNVSFDGNDDQNLHMDDEILGQFSEVEDPVGADGERHDCFPVIPPDLHNSCHSSNQQNVLNSMLKNARIFEGMRYGSAFRRNRMRPRTEETLPLGYPLYLRNSEIAYESSASSNLVHDEFHHHSNIHHPPHSYRDIEPSVIRHIHRSDVEGRMLPDSAWVGGGVSIQPYCRSSCEIYPNPRYQRYQYPVVRRGETQLPYSSYAHIPYPGEVMRSECQQFYDPYLQFHPPSEMRWSSHLSPPRSYYSRGWNNLRSWKPFDSCPASPQIYTDSDSYAWDYDAFSDDQMDKDQMMMNRLQLRNKQLSGQRYFRPIAGGAPFVTCYHCSELLQLPSDFLLFKSRRIHRLKCRNCLSILRFQLEKGNHLVPYSPKAMATASEATKSEYTRNLNSGSSSKQTNHSNCDVPQRSTSSVSQSPAQDMAEGPYSNSSRPQERQESELKMQDSENKGKRIVVESRGGKNASSANSVPRQMKVTWKQPPRSTSPLHRLMGYSSPSQVLRE